MSLLLDTNDALTTDCAVVKIVCDRFDKRREWGDEESSVARPIPARKFGEPSPTRKEETRDWLETGWTSTGVVRGPSRRAALEELTHMVRDLQITQARRDGGEQSRD